MSTGFPRIPPDTPKGLRQFLEALKEAFEVKDATRGSPLDASPTFQDLIDIGFFKSNPNLVLKANGKSFTSSDITNWLSINLPDWLSTTINPQTPTGLVVSGSVSNLVLRWDAWDSAFYGQTLVYRSTTNNLTSATLIGSTTGNTYVDNLPPPGQVYFYWIRHEAKNKRLSDFNDVNGTSVSNVVASPTITYSFDGAEVVLEWPTPTSNLAIQYYVIRYGDVFETSASVGISNTNTLRIPVTWVGARRFWVYGVDVAGGLGQRAFVDVTIVAPTAPVVTQSVQNDALVLTFASSAGSLPVSKFEIRHGPTFDTGTSVFTGSSSRFETAVNWSGTRTFWVVAYDTAGNPSLATQLVFAPVLPSIVSLTVELIDNNVLLRWTQSVGTLSIAYYKVYREGAFYTLVSGRFAPVFEAVSGEYDYGVSAVDSAGNEGPTTTISAQVKQPPDFVLYSNVDSAFSGTKTNVAKDPGDGGLLCNVDPSETWDSHFTSRSWTTIQNQIDAGYPLYVVGKTTGSYREELDYGATIPQTQITMTPTIVAQPYGTVTITPQVSTGVDGSTFPNVYSGYTAFSSNFRYVRFDLAFAATHDGTGLADDTQDIIKLLPLNYRLDLRLKTKEFFVNAVSTDVGGTTLDITGLFIDVQAISAVVIGNAAYFAVIDFTDVANPNSMKVLVFNTSGVRQTATVGIVIRGV